MSQEKLGEAIGLTFQQVQKYERGANRISAGTLYRLGQVLDVPISFFFDGFDEGRGVQSVVSINPVSGGGDSSVISRREARLLRLWRSAPSGIADEMLSLLSSLSPHLRESREGAGLDAVDESEPATASSDFEEGLTPDEIRSERRQRRRHGAVWDPADIFRGNKRQAP